MFLREWRFFSKAPFFWIALAATWLSLGLGGWNGYQRWSSQVKQARLLSQQSEGKLTKQRVRLEYILQALASGHPEIIPKNELIWGPRETLYVDANASQDSFLPAAPLAFLGTGRSDTLPRSYGSSAWRGLEPNAPTTDDPVALLIGDFDLKFVVLAILPLILVLSCFDLLATEREDGTLRLLLSQPVSFRRLLWYRAAVRGALIAGSLFITLVGLVSAVHLAGGFVWIGRLAAYAAISTGYLCLWVLIAICVNLLGRSGTANSLLLGGGWLAMVALIPGMTPVIAEALAPTPSRALYIDLARAARLEVYNVSEDERSRQQQHDAMLAGFLNRHPEWASEPNREELFAAARGEEHSARLAAITNAYDTARQNQDRTIARLSIFSFTAATDRILTEFSGNSDTRQAAFLGTIASILRKI